MAINVPKPTKEFAAYLRPAIAVDVILFTIRNNELMVGLVKREEEPYFGSFALPGRFVRYDERIEDTAKLALKQKCDIDDPTIFLEQLYTFGQNLDRDTRIRTVTIVYYGIIRADRVDFEKNTKLQWHSVYSLPHLAFDHRYIIESAVERMRVKIKTTNLAFQFLPEEFTLTQAQKMHESILGVLLDKRNFRKKIAELDNLIDTRKKFQEGVHRPASLYRLKK